MYAQFWARSLRLSNRIAPDGRGIENWIVGASSRVTILGIADGGLQQSGIWEVPAHSKEIHLPTETLILDEVCDRILSLISAMPEAADGLPPGCRTKEYWASLLTRNDHTRRLLQMLQELPAFTNLASASDDAPGWRHVMEKDFGGPAVCRPRQAAAILKLIVTTAIEKREPAASVKYWRDRFGPEEVIQRVRPRESGAYVPNPHRGTTTFQRFQGDDTFAAWITSDTHGPLFEGPGFAATNGPLDKDNVKYIPRTTLSYCRWPWRWLEPQKGKYRWDIVDQALATAQARGQTLQLRFMPYSARINYANEPIDPHRHPPEVSVNMPDWYWDTGAKWDAKGTYAPNEPDCNDLLYIKHFGDFIRAFAKRYDGHMDLETIDIAYAGFWGECGGNSTPATAAKLADIYLRSFKKTQLLSMHGTPGCKHAAHVTGGTRRHVGWRHDCFGDLRKAYGYLVPPELTWNATYDDIPVGIQTHGLTDAWKTAPVTLETCGNVATWFTEGYDLDTIIREGYRYHMSVFMPKGVFFPAEFRERLVEFDKKIGYRFALRQLTLPLECRVGKRIKMHFFIDNVGCAPIYRPYRLALRFRQEKVAKVVRLGADIRAWMPGHTWFEEKLTVPAGLKKGEVKIDLCIVDRRLQPKVWFAIDDKTADGWHPLTSMDVV